MNKESSVLLPEKLRKEARDQDHFKKLVLNYIQRSYPHYTVRKIKNGFAICDRN